MADMHMRDADQELIVQRFFKEFEKRIESINRASIETSIGPVSQQAFMDVAGSVANIRALYIKEVMKISTKGDSEVPDAETLRRLRNFRQAYEEVVNGFEALSQAVKRGHLDLVD